MQGSLPQESDSQRIGHLAQKCFNAKHPDTWRPKPLDGTDDFGFDYQVQMVVDGFVRDVFRVQLKGTTAPSKSADGSFFSVQLKARTVRYYERATEPILLVLCDLSASPESAASCPLYYCWVEDELRRINNSGLPLEQEYATLRIPKANILAHDTDLSEHVAHHRAVLRAGRALEAIVEEQRPGMPVDARADLVQRIPAGFRSRSYALVEAMAEVPATPWPEAPRGSYSWYLGEALQHLRAGDADAAQASLEAATAFGQIPSGLELAEHWNLRGRALALLGDNQGARDAFAEAARISDNVPRYVACFAEAELRFRHDTEAQNGYEDLLAVLYGSEPETLSIRSRLLAAAGKTAEALAVAKSISGYEGLVAEAIIHTMHSASQQAIDACDTGLAQPSLPEKTRQLFLILRARGRFRLALRRWFAIDGDRVLPLSGPADADIEQLRAAWPDIEAAARSLRRSGWPPNIEFLADVWPSTAAILGKQDETLPLLAEAANARPYLLAVQGALESLAVQCGDFRIALIANNRQPRGATTTLRRVALLHNDKQHAGCVELMHSAEPSLPTSDPMYAPALGMAALSADRIVRTDLADAWAETLSRDVIWAADAALLSYFRSISKMPLGKDDALRVLFEKFESLGRPASIALHILDQLDLGKGEDAEKYLDIATAFQRERLLPFDSALRLGHALAALRKWPQLRQLAQSCCERFDGNARFVALEALALDKMGFTADALGRLRALIATAEIDPVAMNTYINIAVRCGLTDGAIASIEAILSQGINRSERLECLRLLFGLLHQTNPRDPRCVDVAWQLGEQSSPDKEEEEGLFLVTMLAATLHAQVNPSDPRISPFQQRLQEFTSRFPESKILKSITFPESASGDEMLAVLRQISGATEERARWQQRVETQMQRGDLSIPYAWRPKIVLGSVRDVPTLWELTKHSRSDQKQLHLTMSTGEWQPARISDLRGRIPLLDLTALLVLYDLKLFDEVFKVFPTIAIGQRTLIEINQLISPMIGSFVRDRCVDLQTALKRYLPGIMQPVASLDDEEVREELLTSEEIKWLALHKGYLVYSDDALFRMYCDAPGKPASICTLDLLHALDEGGHMPATLVAAKLAQLCDWQVGLSVRSRYQIAALPDELGRAGSVRDGVDFLRQSPVSTAIFNGIWGSSKLYNDLQAQAGALLRELVDRHSNSVVSIASLTALWQEKARLRVDAPTPPVRVIALLIMQAALFGESMSAESARRLWSVFHQMVENDHGDHMDERKEAEAITLAGDIAARIDNEQSLQGDRSLQSRLTQGLTPGTKDESLFSDAYSKARIEMGEDLF